MRGRFALNRNLIQRLGFALLTLMAMATVIPILLVVGYILYKGLPAISWEFLTQFPTDGMRAGGIMPAIVGTVYLTILTTILCVPLGIAAAVYLAEYAPENNFTRSIRLARIGWL